MSINSQYEQKLRSAIFIYVHLYILASLATVLLLWLLGNNIHYFSHRHLTIGQISIVCLNTELIEVFKNTLNFLSIVNKPSIKKELVHFKIESASRFNAKFGVNRVLCMGSQFHTMSIKPLNTHAQGSLLPACTNIN